MLWSLNYGQMALRAPEGLQVLPDGRGAKKAEAASKRENTSGGSFLFFIQLATSHIRLQIKVFLTFCKLVFVFGQIPCPGLTQRPH